MGRREWGKGGGVPWAGLSERPLPSSLSCSLYGRLHVFIFPFRSAWAEILLSGDQGLESIIRRFYGCVGAGEQRRVVLLESSFFFFRFRNVMFAAQCCLGTVYHCGILARLGNICPNTPEHHLTHPTTL